MSLSALNISDGTVVNEEYFESTSIDPFTVQLRYETSVFEKLRHMMQLDFLK